MTALTIAVALVSVALSGASLVYSVRTAKLRRQIDAHLAAARRDNGGGVIR